MYSFIPLVITCFSKGDKVRSSTKNLKTFSLEAFLRSLGGGGVLFETLCLSWISLETDLCALDPF